MDSSLDKADPIHASSTADSQTSKFQAAKPQSTARDLNEEQLQAMRNLDLNQHKTMGYDENYVERLRALGDAWGHVHDGVQGRSTTLSELRDDFRDFKKEVEAIEKFLKSKKR